MAKPNVKRDFALQNKTEAIARRLWKHIVKIIFRKEAFWVPNAFTFVMVYITLDIEIRVLIMRPNNIFYF